MQVQKNTIHNSQVIIEPLQWGTLNHIDDVDPISDNDYAVLEELRQVISKHGYENRFGISLIHKHFELAKDEIALEETDEDARISTVRATKDPGTKNTISTVWRFAKDPTGVSTVTKCVMRCHYMLGHKSRHRIEGH